MMTRARDLEKGDRVIYFGYAIPRRRGDSCKVDAITNADTVEIIFESDKFCTSCKAECLKKVYDNGA